MSADSAARADPDGPAHFLEHRDRDRPRLRGALREDRLQPVLVLAQLGVPGAHGLEHLVDGVRRRDLQVAVAARVGQRRHDGLRAVAAHRGEDVDEVRDARLGPVARDDPGRVVGVGHRALELLLDRLGVVEDVDGPLRRPRGRRHLGRRVLQVHDPGADLRDLQLRDDEHVAEALVEPLRHVAHQLHVLALVVAHRHLVGAVGQDVGGHQHRIGEEVGGDEVALARRLLLELVHAVEVAVRGDRADVPRQLGVLGHVALADEDAPLGLQAGRQQDRRGVVHALAHLLRLPRHGHRVEVDDAEDRDVAGVRRALLPFHVLDDRPDVVAEVLPARGLDPTEDAHVLESMKRRARVAA
jgi:hypothetical protein